MAFSLIPFLLLALPVAEIAVFIVVGQYIGLLATLAMILVTAVIGSALLRIQGFGLLQRIGREAEQGRVPGRELVHGVMILIAGVLLLTPGFITDAIGFLLFVPAVRDLGWRLLSDRIVLMSSSGFAARAGRGHDARPGARRAGDRPGRGGFRAKYRPLLSLGRARQRPLSRRRIGNGLRPSGRSASEAAKSKRPAAPMRGNSRNEMADPTQPNETPNQPTGTDSENGASNEATLSVLAQYIKDLSFENPGAPHSLGQREKAPNININVNVNANPLSETDFDVLLSLDAEARDDKKVVFKAELVYGGVFRISGFPQEHMLPLLFIECPRLLFPFARQVIADATRNGGFPPLMIDPIDFAWMFTQRMEAEQQNQARPNAASPN